MHSSAQTHCLLIDILKKNPDVNQQEVSQTYSELQELEKTALNTLY